MADMSPLTFWQLIRRPWCRHAHASVTPRTEAMPAHLVCRSCGWREPVQASMPASTRTWDSTRDEERYAREKRRRASLALQRQMVEARMAAPTARSLRARRDADDNVFELTRARAR